MCMTRQPLLRIAASLLAGMVWLPALHAAPDSLFHLTFKGRDRTYRVHLPADLRTPAPLVVALHGGGGNALSAIHATGFDAQADRAGFIVVYPNGTGPSHPLLQALGKPGFLTWNAGSCCGYAQEQHIDDVGYIRAVVKQVTDRYRIDPARIYATGMSNGGMMAYTLACEAGDLFAAVGVVSGIVTDPDCRPAEPVSVIHVHGSADQNVPIKGGIGRKALIKSPRPPVKDSIDFWVKADACNPLPQVAHSAMLVITSYSGCREHTAVEYYLIEGGGHAWPGGHRLSLLLDAPSGAMNATDVIWKFFAGHPRQPTNRH